MDEISETLHLYSSIPSSSVTGLSWPGCLCALSKSQESTWMERQSAIRAIRVIVSIQPRMWHVFLKVEETVLVFINVQYGNSLLICMSVVLGGHVTSLNICTFHWIRLTDQSEQFKWTAGHIQQHTLTPQHHCKCMPVWSAHRLSVLLLQAKGSDGMTAPQAKGPTCPEPQKWTHLWRTAHSTLS